MENVDFESAIRNGDYSNDSSGRSQAVSFLMTEVDSFAPLASDPIICGENGTRKDAIYKAVLALSRSIAGRTDLRSLVSGVAESLRSIFKFDHAGLILHDPTRNAMEGYIWNEPFNPVLTSLRLPIDQDPAGWVWLNQQPLLISHLDFDTRWPEAARIAGNLGISTLVLVPLTAGERRLGALGVSAVAPLDPSSAEIAFLQRVADEFAVAVESFLAKQEALRERDRLRTLCDITNALVSKLGRDELFSVISDQLSTIIRHDYAMLTLCNENGCLEPYALHSTGPDILEDLKEPFDPAGMPAADVLATGKPVVACATDVDRYPAIQRFLALGFKSI